ncbi:hypothetical protein C8R46DRAFT_521251 [Mycena filopes]|nr:hypothetical protein C8R46DRAFT_521251 [Mycena filopes]
MSFLRPCPLPRRVCWLGARLIHSKTPLLSTLNPRALQPTDFLDISDWKRHPIAFEADPGGTNPRPAYGQAIGDGWFPFPPRSRGFFYFHRGPGAAPLEGSLRFRLSPNKLPSYFGAGRDLLLPAGLPWQLILPQLLQPPFQKVVAQLLRDNLITATQILRCREVFGTGRKIVPSSTLFRLAQEFPVDFGARPVLALVGESLHCIQLAPFSFQTGPPILKKINPFTGSGLARFEPVADSCTCGSPKS